ncbi:glycosyltransferase [Nocardia alni]|uniref:glycosyltransferase n=1 Tax=Nocardia alni TaxID=2815723 RepID=UPI001C22A425|nr:nucleotide disphospho-sugar-binding domain-containing protein [Nocardia alni]
MEGFLGARTLLAAGPDLGELLAENARRASGDPTNFGEASAALFAGTRVDLTWEDALKQALEFEPDLIVGEWVDFVTPLLAAKFGVPWVAHSIGGPLPVEFVGAMRRRAEQQHGRLSVVPRERLALVDPFPDSLRLSTDTAPEADRVMIRPGGVAVSFAGRPSLPVPSRPAGTARVLLTMGTTVDDAALLSTLARAVAETGVDVLVTSEPERLEAHERVHAIGFTPLDELLPEVDVVIGSAGSGTLLASLAAGVPSVLFPVLADQPLNAARASHRGVAEVLADPAEAGAAVGRVLGDPAYRRAAKEVAAEIATLPAPEKVLAELLSLGGLS